MAEAAAVGGAEVEALLDPVLNDVTMSIVIGELAAAHRLPQVVFVSWICGLISLVK